MNKIGGLYQVKKFHWLLFLSKETADRMGLLSHEARRWTIPTPLTEGGATEAAAIAADMGERYKCDFSYVSPKDILVLLEINKKHRKVLTTEGKLGWIFIDDGYYDYYVFFEEVTNP